MAGTVAVFQAAATRIAQAGEALEERFAGILVSDPYDAYAWAHPALAPAAMHIL